MIVSLTIQQGTFMVLLIHTTNCSPVLRPATRKMLAKHLPTHW